MSFIPQAPRPIPAPAEISRAVAEFERFINIQGLNLEVTTSKIEHHSRPKSKG